MTDCYKCKEYDKEKNYCPVFCNVINDTLTDRAIEELEKIKKEIEEEKIDIDLNIGQERLYNNAINDVMQIIDNHISELKGENKLTCERNICLQNEYNNIGCEDCVVTKGETTNSKGVLEQQIAEAQKTLLKSISELKGGA